MGRMSKASSSLRDEQKEQKMKRAEEIKRQLELKKVEYEAIKQQNEILQQSYESSLKANSEQRSQHINRGLFTQYCDEAKVKYADFEQKIKKVEQKVTGSICGTFDLDEAALFAKFVDTGLGD